MRNKMYDLGSFSSKSYDFPVICVGNLSTGGTGKSPMTEYLIRLFNDTSKVAILSRGYGRKTKGYVQVQPEHSAAEVGDEPLQFAQKFPEAFVAVSEDRQTGIAHIQKNFGIPEVLILDDAFQHRKVNAGFYILLTAYGNLYTNDYVLPAGNLREPRSGASRADIIVVTKCPKNLSTAAQVRLRKQLSPKEHQQLFFSTIQYSATVFSATGGMALVDFGATPFILVTGIANPAPLVDHLRVQGFDFTHQGYGDHHIFAQSELKKLDMYDVILTTEKDYMRLKGKLKKAHLYYLPIEMKFLGSSEQFDNLLREFKG